MSKTVSKNTSSLQEVALGQGYSTASGKVRSCNVEATPGQANGGATSVKIFITQSSTEFESVLGLDIKKNIDFEELLSFKEKMDFLNKVQVTETSVCVVVSSKIELPVDYYPYPALLGGETKEATLRTAADIDAFCTTYGDSYVSTVTRGAQFLCVYKYECQSLHVKNKIYEEISASGIVDGFNGSVSYGVTFDNIINKYHSMQQLEMHAFGTQWAIPSSKNAIEMAFAFQTIETQNITGVLDFSLTGYEHLFKTAAAQDAFMQVRINRELLNGDATQKGLIEKGNALLKARQQADEIVAFYAWYGVNPDNLDAQLSEIKSDLQDYSKVLDSFNYTPSAPISPVPSLATFNYGIPSRNCELEGVHTAYGGTGGNEFNDNTALRILNEKWRLSKVSARGDAWLNWLQIQYKNPNGDEKNVTHGEPGGKPASELALDGCDICSVGVAHRPGDWYQNYLQITTSTGVQLLAGTAPSSSEIASIFQVGSSKKSAFLGFFGSSCLYIDSLGGISVRFGKITWH